MTDILTQIATYKQDFVAHRRHTRPLAEVRRAARDTESPRGFVAALQEDGVSLIAEVKKASPSKGVIRADFDPEQIAAQYAESGARALSVLTDEAYFQGCDAYLQRARRVSGLPVLRKDFTIDIYQIYEARALGADAVLIIAALMDGGQLDDFMGSCNDLGMDALVEVHTPAELAYVLDADPALVGINNRDLATFTTSLEATLELLPRIPEQITVVSESGIHAREDVLRLQTAGVDAILVGEALMGADDVGAAVRRLLGT